MFTFNCEYCGAIIDYSKDKDVCPHCGSAYKDTVAYKNQFEQDVKIRVMLAIDGVDEKQEKEIRGKLKTPTRFILCDSCGEKIILGKYDRCPHCGSDYQHDKEFFAISKQNYRCTNCTEI